MSEERGDSRAAADERPERRALTREEIEAEVRRLAPWYYAFDLNGVRTDATEPCDRHGHRRVAIPPQVAPFLDGRSVLDVGCNEGGYSFAALECGARSVLGFDVREINIEKARFVARVKGYRTARFEVGAADEWQDPARSDVVMLCGLLYHLPRPWETIERYCALARESIFVTCVLSPTRFVDGYTAVHERAAISASARPGQEPSLHPNTSHTLLREFARHGFQPVLVEETEFGKGAGRGGRLRRLLGLHVDRGCVLFLQRRD